MISHLFSLLSLHLLSLPSVSFTKSLKEKALNGVCLEGSKSINGIKVYSKIQQAMNLLDCDQSAVLLGQEYFVIDFPAGTQL